MDAREARTDFQAGRLSAEQVLALLEDASNRRVVVGCPAGRTPRSTYRALGELAASHRLDLSRLAIVMMDEFLVELNGKLRYCDLAALYSCRRFAEIELRRVLNAGLSPDHQLPSSQIYFPDPDDPGRFEDLIAELGGINFFILASGASDGAQHAQEREHDAGTDHHGVSMQVRGGCGKRPFSPSRQRRIV